MIGGKLRDGDDGFDEVNGIVGAVFLVVGGASLNSDEPPVKGRVRGQGGDEFFLDVSGPLAVAQPVSISSGCAGARASSSSGHDDFSFK